MDRLSHPKRLLSPKWSLLSWVFDAICEVFSHLHIDFFLPKQTRNFLCMCVWFQVSWPGNRMLFNIPGTISVPTHFPLCSSKTGLVECEAFDKSLLGHGSSSLASEGVVRICWLLWWSKL